MSQLLKDRVRISFDLYGRCKSDTVLRFLSFHSSNLKNTRLLHRPLYYMRKSSCRGLFLYEDSRWRERCSWRIKSTHWLELHRHVLGYSLRNLVLTLNSCRRLGLFFLFLYRNLNKGKSSLSEFHFYWVHPTHTATTTTQFASPVLRPAVCYFGPVYAYCNSILHTRHWLVCELGSKPEI